MAKIRLGRVLLKKKGGEGKREGEEDEESFGPRERRGGERRKLTWLALGWLGWLGRERKKKKPKNWQYRLLAAKTTQRHHFLPLQLSISYLRILRQENPRRIRTVGYVRSTLVLVPAGVGKGRRGGGHIRGEEGVWTAEMMRAAAITTTTDSLPSSSFSAVLLPPPGYYHKR